MISIRHKWIWAVLIVVVLLGVVGCSAGADPSVKEKERIDETLWQWNQAKNMASSVLDDYDQKDSVSFGRELLGALGKMEEAKDELDDLAGQVTDPKLTKNAKLCAKGMGTVNKAVRDYGGALQAFLGSLELGDDAQVNEATDAAEDSHKKYLKELKKGRDLMNRSTL